MEIVVFRTDNLAVLRGFMINSRHFVLKYHISK